MIAQPIEECEPVSEVGAGGERKLPTLRLGIELVLYRIDQNGKGNFSQTRGQFFRFANTLMNTKDRVPVIFLHPDDIPSYACLVTLHIFSSFPGSLVPCTVPSRPSQPRGFSCLWSFLVSFGLPAETYSFTQTPPPHLTSPLHVARLGREVDTKAACSTQLHLNAQVQPDLGLKPPNDNTTSAADATHTLVAPIQPVRPVQYLSRPVARATISLTA